MENKYQIEEITLVTDAGISSNEMDAKAIGCAVEHQCNVNYRFNDKRRRVEYNLIMDTVLSPDG